ncbi:MAG: hypothetical protein VR66_16905 [Peptococcaceae bacterium BRH_c23]|nr:MAG: hypothetical protein VR66_16905 [Peptococcaceae bacterium BRH_c23]KJS90297.1 MAG: hypothetical protein JL57_02370 [Desulfosporosinus sp. BICA1-9]HBW38534.1 hypothetical protein [Desulfosporosinus sp.]
MVWELNNRKAKEVCRVATGSLLLLFKKLKGFENKDSNMFEGLCIEYYRSQPWKLLIRKFMGVIL